MPNALEMLKQDHETVKELFDKYEKAGGFESKAGQEAAQAVFAELLTHTQIEEEIFYPILQDAEPKAVQLVAEGIEEHHAAEALISDLMKRGAENEEYAAKMTTLMASVRHHVEEEESEIFPLAEKALRDRLGGIGRQINSRKQEILLKAA